MYIVKGTIIQPRYVYIKKYEIRNKYSRRRL